MKKKSFLQGLKKAIISKKKIIISSMLLSLLLTGLPIFLILTSDFEAVSQLHMGSMADSHDRLLPIEKQDPQIADAYAALLKSEQVLRKTTQNLQLPLTIRDLYERTDIFYLESSNILRITFRHPDERLAVEIADAIALAGKEELSSELKAADILFIPADGAIAPSVIHEVLLISMAISVLAAGLFISLLSLVLEMKSAYSNGKEERTERSRELQTVFK